MKQLNEYVARENQFAAIFKRKPLSLKSASDRQKIADSIDCALSPENLSCDGEISASQVRTKYRFLTAAAKQLQELDPSVKFYEFA